MRVGIEVGGTFTDLVAIDGSHLMLCKVPSTPHAPNIGALDAIRAAGLSPSKISDLVHGSTVATNAVLERKGAKLAFIATTGFKDLLFLQRHSRTKTFDLYYQKPTPVVSRSACLEVIERIDASGSVITALDEDHVRETLVEQLRQGEYAAVAICLINSYINPAHEEALEKLLSELLPDLPITRSTVVSREFREYERASTTALAAYVQPVIHRYLTDFVDQLKEQGFKGRLSLMQSNGGRLPMEGMRRNPVTSILSGPAAGVTGATKQLARSGLYNLLTFDMGGTSTDVSIVFNGKPTLAPEMYVDDMPVRTPVLDIVTVGAGGGSITWLDEGGMLHVGPRSAGAAPGPACYGKGGELPTVTDALVLLGVIEAGSTLGGTIRIDADKARESFQALAARFNTSEIQMARNAIKLAVSNIVRAIQLVSTERGHSPRDFALTPFGGAAPLIAAAVAEELQVRTVVVPPNPGVMSAFGLLASDDQKITTISRKIPADASAPQAIRQLYREIHGELTREATQLGLQGPYAYALSADMRFVGQAFEIPVPIPVDQIDSIDTDLLNKSFDAAHRQVFLHGADDRPIEIVSLRITITSPVEQIDVVSALFQSAEKQTRRQTQIYFADQGETCSVVEESTLAVDELIQGPALIKGHTSAVFVPRDWSAQRDHNANIVLNRSE